MEAEKTEILKNIKAVASLNVPKGETCFAMDWQGYSEWYYSRIGKGWQIYFDVVFAENSNDMQTALNEGYECAKAPNIGQMLQVLPDEVHWNKWQIGIVKAMFHVEHLNGLITLGYYSKTENKYFIANGVELKASGTITEFADLLGQIFVGLKKLGILQ